MTKPLIRLYGWHPRVRGNQGRGGFTTWTSDNYSTPYDFRDTMERLTDGDALLLMYQVYGGGILPAKTPLLAKDVCREAFLQGTALLPPRGARALLWEEKIRELIVLGQSDDAPAITVSAAVGPRTKPKTEIVQSWAARMDRDAPGEIARRAWEATQAMVKGG